MHDTCSVIKVRKYQHYVGITKTYEQNVLFVYKEGHINIKMNNLNTLRI